MTEAVLAIDVLSEIESKVKSEIARQYVKVGGDLSEREEETLHHVLFASIAKATLNLYQEKSIPIRGISYIKLGIDAARMYMADRIDEIDTASDVAIPQLENQAMTHGYEKAGMLGMRVDQVGWSAEDWAFGLPPTGGRYAEIKLRFDDTKAKIIAEKKYDPTNKTVEEILADIPRKHVIKDQTYLLDVEKTLEGAGISLTTGHYFKINEALKKERDDPLKREELQMHYAEIELKKLSAALPGSQEEVDDA